MARSATEVEQSLAASISDISPGLATKVGPIRQGIIRPVSAEISTAEVESDHLAQLVSLNFSEASTDQELENLAAALGLERFGKYRIEHGQLEPGKELLSEAQTIFRRLGMQPDALRRVMGDLYSA